MRDDGLADAPTGPERAGPERAGPERAGPERAEPPLAAAHALRPWHRGRRAARRGHTPRDGPRAVDLPREALALSLPPFA